MEQRYFEDIEEGSEVPTLRKDPTPQQLVKYAGASGDFYQIHYDVNFAKNNALKTIIVNKTNKNDAISILGQPSTKGLTNDNLWIYIERTRARGKIIGAEQSSERRKVAEF